MKAESEYKKSLIDCDCEEDECPQGFDWHKAADRVTKFSLNMDSELSPEWVHKGSTGYIQDARFHDLLLFNLGAKDGLQSIRFSNFGRLAAVTDVEQIPPEKFEKLLELFKSHGYQHVPIEILEQPYDGKFDDFKDLYDGTWFCRYFSYI